jgi:hypothetical protein
MRRANSVWVPPSATSFSCLCEACLELARSDGRSFVVVRRISTPAPLGHRDGRQLQIV